jgi:hypothetical protein
VQVVNDDVAVGAAKKTIRLSAAATFPTTG